MTSFADAWRQAGEAHDLDPTDGHYKAKLVDGDTFTSKSGNELVKLVWELLSGPEAGRQFDDINGITHPVGLRITREKLIMLGLKPDGIQDLDSLGRAIDAIVPTIADIHIRHQNGYLNVSVTRSFTGESDVPSDMHPQQQSFAAAAAGGSPAVKHDDDDPPF